MAEFPGLYLRNLLVPYTEQEKHGLTRTALFRSKGYGYMHEQTTKPQTLGYSLADSPVGLLAWIYEKLVDWTDEYAWEDDEGWPSFVKRSRYHPLIVSSLVHHSP